MIKYHMHESAIGRGGGGGGGGTLSSNTTLGFALCMFQMSWYLFVSHLLKFKDLLVQ